MGSVEALLVDQKLSLAEKHDFAWSRSLVA